MDVMSALLLAMSLDVMGRLHKIVYHDLTTHTNSTCRRVRRGSDATAGGGR
jgi:hypothetical protein